VDSPVASKVEQDFECESLGIQEQQLAIGFYPNPTKNRVNFKILQDVQFTLISPLGQRVLEGNLTGDNKQIDLSQFSASVYYLYIEGQVIKLIKYD
jgi:hypothetical protein